MLFAPILNEYTCDRMFYSFEDITGDNSKMANE